jgi:hypothetical protein
MMLAFPRIAGERIVLGAVNDDLLNGAMRSCEARCKESCRNKLHIDQWASAALVQKVLDCKSSMQLNPLNSRVQRNNGRTLEAYSVIVNLPRSSYMGRPKSPRSTSTVMEPSTHQAE